MRRRWISQTALPQANAIIDRRQQSWKVPTRELSTAAPGVGSDHRWGLLETEFGGAASQIGPVHAMQSWNGGRSKRMRRATATRSNRGFKAHLRFSWRQPPNSFFLFQIFFQGLRDVH